MSGAIHILTYHQLSYLLTQLIYARTKLPQKGLFLFRKAWNMPVLFSICFYQIHINMTNDCVSVTKILVKGVELMTDTKNTHIKSNAKMNNCHKKNSYIFVHNSDCKTSYIDIYIDLLSINFNLLSVLWYYAYHRISNFEIFTALTTI